MISVTHYRASDAGFEARAQEALAVLSVRSGFLRGKVGRSTDEPEAWVLVTEWKNVGSYRRALGNHDVKLRASPLLGDAIDLPSSFESLVDVVAGGDTTTHASDRA